MKKKNLTIMLAGAMAAGMSAGSVQAAAAEDASGDLYVFIAASLSNAMEDIQKDFNKEYPDVNILFNADSSGTLQTQIEEGSRCDVFFSAATKQMDALVDEELADKDSVVDLLENKEDLIAVIAEYSKLFDFIDIVPVSVLEKDGLDIIMEDLEKNAVEGPHYFPDDKFTDQPEKVIMAEIIREKALNNLNDEVPHGIAVTIEHLNERENRNGEAILDVTATIYCERESHKGILIGKGGSMLRKIGQEARADLEDFFQIKVNLQCWVKVKEGWRNREGMIKNFGLE